MKKPRKFKKSRREETGAHAAPVFVSADEEPRPTSAMAVRLAKALTKEFGNGTVLPLVGEGAYVSVRWFIPFSIESLESAVGAVGVPVGHLTEISGPEGSGKTSLVLRLIERTQAIGGTAVLVDNEHSFDPERASRDYGVNLQDLIVTQPDTVEDALAYIDKIAEEAKGRDEIVGVFWDSIGGGLTKAELEGDYDQSHYAAAAKVLTPGLKKLAIKIDESNIALVAINQVRDNIGAGPFAPKTRTPGGRALKHTAFLRLELSKRETIKKGQFALGIVVNVRVMKNKIAPPFRNAKFSLYFDGRTIQSLAGDEGAE